MKTHCLNHNKVHEYHTWRNYGKGWFCTDKRTYTEFVPQRIKDDRIKYFKSTLQPYRDGKLSKEYAEVYPKRAEKMASKEEIKNSKYLWKDLPGWDYRHKSK